MTFYKPIASLIIKIFMIGNQNQILRFPNGFHNITGENEYDKTGHSKIFTF